MSLGLLTRVATAATFAIVTYNVFLSTTHFHNNRAYLIIVLGLLAVALPWTSSRWTPGSAAVAGDRPSTRGRPAGRCGCFGSSAPRSTARRACRSLDPDWFGGTVTWQRVVRARDDLEGWPLPDWAISVLTDEGSMSRRRSSSCSPSSSSRRALVAGHALRRRLGCGRLPPQHRDVRIGPGLPLLGIAVLLVWAACPRGTGCSGLRSRLPQAAGRRRGSARTGSGASTSSRPARVGAGGHRPGRHRDSRPTRRRVRVQPPAAHRLVRPGPPCSCRPSAARVAPPRDDARPRGRERTVIAKRPGRPASRSCAAPSRSSSWLRPSTARRSPRRSFALRSRQASTGSFAIRMRMALWPLPLQRRRRPGCARVQRGPLPRGDDGLLPGRSGGPPGALRSADRGTEWALDTLHEGDEGGGREPGRGLDRGERALVAGLAIRREATGEERYDQDLRRLGHFLLSQTEPTGAVLALYDPVAGKAVAGEYRTTTPRGGTGPRPPAPGVPSADKRQRTASARTRDLT